MRCECAECRALADELRANAEALKALRDEELPPLVVRIRRRAPVYSWVAAVAAAVLLALALPHLWRILHAPAPRPGSSEPLKIKMLTPDPDVVIYWLIDAKEGQ
jgi:hypothetical protein